MPEELSAGNAAFIDLEFQHACDHMRRRVSVKFMRSDWSTKSETANFSGIIHQILLDSGCYAK